MKKIAIVHDWLTNMGGAEQCVINFKEIFKDAPIYTLLFNPEKIDPRFLKYDIHTSFLQKLPGHNSHQKFFPLMPLAWESFDFSEYDTVLSSTSCCAKGIITRTACTHICYCYTPIRYVWEKYTEYYENKGCIVKFLIRIFLHYIRLWDYIAAQRVDYYIAVSTTVQSRIKKFYGKDSEVIFPPVRCSLFNISETDGDYYIVLSRLVKYKRFDLAVQACTALKKKLIVIGVGPEEARLRKMAGPTVTFLQHQPDDIVKKYMSECKALLFPGEEDFGIVPVEAQACGRPVIAYAKGGALDSIIDGKTGILFETQSSESLQNAIQKFETMCFDKTDIRQHALNFDEKKFQEKIESYINKVSLK